VRPILRRLDAGLLIAPGFDANGDPPNSDGEEQILNELPVVWFLFQLPSVYRAGRRPGRGESERESAARLFLSERTSSENEHNSISRLDPPPLFIYP